MRVSGRERTSSDEHPGDGKTGRRLLRLHEQASIPAHLPRKMGSDARQSLRLRRASLPFLSLAGGGQEPGRGGPHATRANRSGNKGQRAGHVGRQKRAKGRGPGQTENGKKEGRVLGTQKWAKGTGPDTRADRNRQRALGRQLTKQRAQLPGTW